MDDESEIIGDNGDRWVVRACDGDDGCVVVERYVARCAPDRFARLVNDYARASVGMPPEHPEGEPDDDPSDEVHVPADVLPALVKALARQVSDRAAP